MSQVQTLKKSGRTVLLLSWTHKSFPRKLGVKEMHLEPLCLKQRNTLAWPAPRRPPRHPRDTRTRLRRHSRTRTFSQAQQTVRESAWRLSYHPPRAPCPQTTTRVSRGEARLAPRSVRVTPTVSLKPWWRVHSCRRTAGPFGSRLVPEPELAPC